MCRLLGYLGQPILLDNLLAQPEHSLIVQSYQPREMTAGLLNADGFGVGWYHLPRSPEPFTYKNTLPIWSDINLPHLNRYVESGCVLANVRSATPGQPVDLSNCQPFSYGNILAIHNGFIEDFRHSLYRPIRNQLHDEYYKGINGSTDSEHIFALLLHNLQQLQVMDLVAALQTTLRELLGWANDCGVTASLNLVIGDGRQLVASRCASRSPAPSLYWLQGHPHYTEAIIVASEPLFASDRWVKFPENSILAVRPADPSATSAELETQIFAV